MSSESENKQDWKKIKRQILIALKNNISKQDIYEQYAGKVEDVALRKFLAARPNPDLELKYKIVNKFILWMWMLFFVLELLGSMEDFLLTYDITLVISVVVSLVLTIQISKMNGDAYLPGIIWFAWGMAYSYRDIRNESYQESEFSFFISLFFSYLLIGIILMCIIKTRVFPYYSWFQPVKDENGNFIFQELSGRKIY